MSFANVGNFYISFYNANYDSELMSVQSNKLEEEAKIRKSILNVMIDFNAKFTNELLFN